MALERVTIDPITDFPLGTLPVRDDFAAPLDLSYGGGQVAGGGIFFGGAQYPLSEAVIQWAEALGAEGAKKAGEDHYPLRELVYRCMVIGGDEPATTNLIGNPSIELTASGGGVGWSSSTSTYGRDRSRAAHGDASAKITTQNAQSGALFPAGSGFQAVTPNTTYTFSAYLWTEVAGKQMDLVIQERDGSGNLLATQTEPFVTEAGVWMRPSITRTLGATTSQVRLMVRTSSAQGVFDFWLDATQLEAQGYATEYCDGDVPGCAWSGAHHASASTRPAPADRFNAILNDLETKVAKIAERGGQWRRHHLASNRMIVYDLVHASLRPVWDDPIAASQGGQYVELVAQAKPLWRGPKRLVGTDHVETTKPALIFVESGLEGNAPGIAQVVVDNDSAERQNYLEAAVRVATYSAAAEAALHYEAERLTPLGQAVLFNATWASKIAGDTTSVVRNADVPTSWSPMVETKVAASGKYFAHVGRYRVKARIQVSHAKTALSFEYGSPDFTNPTRLREVEPPVVGEPVELDFGVVNIPPVTAGTQQWVGRLVTKAEASGRSVEVDWLELYPVDEGYLEVRTPPPSDAPEPVVGLDDLSYSDNPTVGLSTKSATVGGPWDMWGAFTDWTVGTGGGYARRTTTADSIVNPPIVYLSSLDLTDFMVECEFKWTARPTAPGYPGRSGLTVRSVGGGSSQGLHATLGYADATHDSVALWSGTGGGDADVEIPMLDVTKWHKFRIIMRGARAQLWLATEADGVFTFGADPLVEYTGSAFAAGAANDSGAIGLLDWMNSAYAANPLERRWRNIVISPLASDAVIFPGQSAELRHDRFVREDAAGAVWTQLPIRGRYLRPRAALREGRSAEFIIRTLRNDPELGDDPVVRDALSAQLYWTGRGLGWNPEV